MASIVGHFAANRSENTANLEDVWKIWIGQFVYLQENSSCLSLQQGPMQYKLFRSRVSQACVLHIARVYWHNIYVMRDECIHLQVQPCKLPLGRGGNTNPSNFAVVRFKNNQVHVYCRISCGKVAVFLTA